VEGTTLGTHKARVLAAIQAAGTQGLTWSEAEAASGVPQCWRRVSDLLLEHSIHPTGRTRRAASTGKQQRVYVAGPAPAPPPPDAVGFEGW
jgi:hypothetical protein